MEKQVLDTLDMRELGAELRKARERRGLTQQDASEILQVARTTITAIEKGERRIKATELVKLARAYGQSVGDLVRSERPTAEAFQPQFRAASRHTDKQKQIADSTVELFETLSKNYLELERIVGDPLPYKYPDEYQFTGSRLEQLAENIAAQERTRLGLGDAPLPILRDLLEHEVGLRIFYIKIQPAGYSAMYVYDRELGGCIAINADEKLTERRRWSLAHEYAHFLVHRHYADVLDETYDRLPERERFADAFASYFLMPATSLLRQVGTKDVTRRDLFVLANYYGVSVEAMTRRLEGLKIIPVGTWDDMRGIVKIREIQEKLNLDPVPDYDEMLPRRYMYLAVEAYTRSLISEGKFTKLMQLDRVEARELIEALSLLQNNTL